LAVMPFATASLSLRCSSGVHLSARCFRLLSESLSSFAALLHCDESAVSGDSTFGSGDEWSGVLMSRIDDDMPLRTTKGTRTVSPGRRRRVIPTKGFMFRGSSVAIIHYHPVLATPLAGKNFDGMSQSCCAFSTVSSLNVCEIMWSLNECWTRSSLDFAAQASRSLNLKQA
jgi:hypothetical protein